MENELKGYLHLYLGCEIKRPAKKSILVGLVYKDGESWPLVQDYYPDGLPCGRCYSVTWNHKPILRPLSDMKEEELKEWGEIGKDICLKHGDDVDGSEPYFWFEYTRYLLSRGFDVFGLIESGLAIDKTKLP